MALRVPDAPSEAPLIQLAPMRRRHLRSVLRIEGQVYPRPWPLKLFVSELSLRATRAYRVARAEGTVVGYGGLMLAGPDAHVTNLAVDPAHQRQGIGSLLLADLATHAVERRCRNLTLEVRVGNLGAQGLYRAFGFVPAGIRRNYYVETNEDALIMWAHDIDTEDYSRRLARLLTTRASRLAPPTI
ncbi:MAG: ribosomal protein S18-alanine N-acetyltransferase [Acidimicrobiales bacterium]